MSEATLFFGQLALALAGAAICMGLDRPHPLDDHRCGQEAPRAATAVSREEELAEDVQRLVNFLAVLIGEAAQLGLPLPESVTECLTSLATWARQLRESDAR